MKIFEVEEKQVQQPIPMLYLDMDGVQADFFTSWALWHGEKINNPEIQRYKQIGDKEKREESIRALQAEGPEFVYKFFATLPPLPNGMALVDWIKRNKIPCTILSAPLRSSPEDKQKLITAASIEGKKHWLSEHNPGLPMIFDGMKERYAMKGGHPNVLVDDHKKYIESWEGKGGIGILHREQNTDQTIEALTNIYKQYL
jgi:hypothetical protein